MAPIVPVDSLDEAIALANSTRFGLGANVYTRDLETAVRCMREIKAGTVWINDPLTDNDAGPFGGMKQSGLGRELGQEGLEAFQDTKHVHIETKIAPKEWWYPYAPGQSGPPVRGAAGPESRPALRARVSPPPAPAPARRRCPRPAGGRRRRASRSRGRRTRRARARASARSAFLARATVFFASQGGALSASVTFCSGIPDSSSAAARCTSRSRRMIGKTSRPGRSP